MLTVAIAEDHPVFMEALDQLLEKSRHRVRTVRCVSFDELTEKLRQTPVANAVLLDLEIPGVHGFSGLAYLRFHHPEARVAIVSGHESPDIVRRAMLLGADSFIPKSLGMSAIVDALNCFLDGEVWLPESCEGAESGHSAPSPMSRLSDNVSALTPQQQRILMGMAKGRLNKQIAFELGVTEGTVKNHVTGILRQLNMRRRTEVVAAINNLLHFQGASGGSADLQLEPESADCPPPRVL